MVMKIVYTKTMGILTVKKEKIHSSKTPFRAKKAKNNKILCCKSAKSAVLAIPEEKYKRKEYLFHTSTTSRIPLKMILHQRFYRNLMEHQRIVPIHLQLSVTNTCNLNCSFCSFKNRDSHSELSLDEVRDIIDAFAALGIEAVTLTGGGEPLCHPYINEIISLCRQKQVKTALVTNGLLLETLNDESLRTLTWCRISVGDDRTTANVERIAKVLRTVCPKAPNIAWSFSYVVLERQNPEIQHKIVLLAKELNMLNVRFSPDQHNVEKADLGLTAETNKNEAICIYDEKIAENVLPGCWLYLVKPFVAADGYIYPCCCTHYNFDGKNTSGSSRICFYKDFKEKLRLMETYKPQCYKCYFRHYNEFIDAVLQPIIHSEWV
jgi:MoaA/NifB/PqqE/SkfB family radical SAM enzyme